MLYVNTILPREGFEAARAEITSWPDYAPTPLDRLSGLATALGLGGIWYKDEGQRFGLGSFKALGGAYAVLRVLQSAGGRAVTVTTATDGNHGRAVAWAAQRFGCRAVIYIPRSCSPARESAIATYGAEVVRTSVGYDETVRLCIQDAETHGRLLVSDTSWEGYEDMPRTVMQGYRLIAHEVLEQVPVRLTHVFVQAGVGGLAAALCTHFRGELRFVVVEPEGTACLYASAVAGRLTPCAGEVHTIMAGLECGIASPLAWKVLASGADAFLTIPDAAAAPCMRLLAQSPYGDPPIVAGESAVAGLAGLMWAAGDPDARSALALGPESQVLLIGTEGATDPSIYEALVRDG